MMIVYRHIEGGIKGYIGTERALLKTGKCAAILHELDRSPEISEMLDQVTGQIVPRPLTADESEKVVVQDQIIALLAKPDADVTNAELKWLVLKMAKYMLRKGI